MRRALIICILLFITSSFIHAQEIKDVVLEADKLSYSEDGTVVEAHGNVTATHKDVIIRSQNLIYKISEGALNAWGGFKMDMKGGVSLVGESLNYDLKTKKGDAKNVNLSFAKAAMKGDDIILQEDEMSLNGSSFTGCNQKDPHYHISASRLILYPEEGWIVCYFGFFWFDGIPVIPVPAYVFNLYADKEGNRKMNMPPLPEFGSNPVDGSYANTRFAWILNKRLNGNFLISWAEKNGWGGGMEGDYLYNERNSGNFRIYYDPKNTYYGGLTHTYSFGQSIDTGNKYFFGIFNARDKFLFDLITDFSYRERINYEKVSVLPDVTLRMNDMPILTDRMTANASITYGVVSEESTIRTGRGIIKSGLKYNIPTNAGLFGLGLGYDQEWYENAGHWTRVMQTTSYGNSWGDLKGGVEHLHYLENDGVSPFNYENYRLIRSDEIIFDLSYNFMIHRFGIVYDYFVPSWNPRELDYSLSIGFHCYSIDLTYRAMRKEYLFGLSLVIR